MKASSTYLVELGYDPPELIRVGAFHMRRLVRPGSLVRTNYSSGPYVVVAMKRYDWLNPANSRRYDYWCFSCDHPERDGPRWPRPTAWLNEYVAIGRRILGLMNDDEILVDGFSDEAAKIIARRETPKPAQMDLFA